MKWPHFHSDPNWELRNCNYYYQCSCGARRVKRAYRNMYGVIERGWPRLVDGHGRPLNDTGWVKQ